MTRRSVIRLTVSLAVALTIAGIAAWWMMSQPPSWYRPPDANDLRVIRLADDVEYRLLEEAHRPRMTEETWTIRLREHQANAWLAARLRKWVAFDSGAEWPEALGTPQIRITGDGIDLGVDVKTSSGKRYMIIHLLPEVQEDRLIVRATGLSVGRLGIRTTSMDRMASMLAPQHRAQFFESELGRALMSAFSDGASFESVASLSDGRQLSIGSLALHEGALDLTFSTMESDGEGRRHWRQSRMPE